MTGSNDDHCGRRKFMDARDLAPPVAKFAHRLSASGYTELAVRTYDDEHV
jgi:hypothetical protein